jgi:hypothetical protein
VYLLRVSYLHDLNPTTFHFKAAWIDRRRRLAFIKSRSQGKSMRHWHRDRQIGQSSRWLLSGCLNKSTSHLTLAFVLRSLCSCWHVNTEYRYRTSLQVHLFSLISSTCVCDAARSKNHHHASLCNSRS